jgi:hypothetical protein
MRKRKDAVVTHLLPPLGGRLPPLLPPEGGRLPPLGGRLPPPPRRFHRSSHSASRASGSVMSAMSTRGSGDSMTPAATLVTSSDAKRERSALMLCVVCERLGADRQLYRCGVGRKMSETLRIVFAVVVSMTQWVWDVVVIWVWSRSGRHGMWVAGCFITTSGEKRAERRRRARHYRKTGRPEAETANKLIAACRGVMSVRALPAAAPKRGTGESQRLAHRGPEGPFFSLGRL